MPLTLNRRTFLLGAAAFGAGTRVAAASPSEKVVCAVIGVRGRGRAFYRPLAARKDAAVAALCDVDANVLADATRAVIKAQGRAPRAVEDFRRVLDDPAIDAVFITRRTTGTPPSPSAP